MSCKYNNSMYTTIPPATLIVDLRYDENFEDAIDEHNYEEKEFYSYVDIDELRNLELIKNAEKSV